MRLGPLAKLAAGMLAAGAVLVPVTPAFAASSISTNASGNITLGSGTLTDTASVSGLVDPQLGATIEFRLYGPNDATCATAIFTAAGIPYPVAGWTRSPHRPSPPPRPAPTAGEPSTPATPTTPPVSGACNDPNETSVVNPAPPSISTTPRATSPSAAGPSPTPPPSRAASTRYPVPPSSSASTDPTTPPAPPRSSLPQESPTPSPVGRSPHRPSPPPRPAPTAGAPSTPATPTTPPSPAPATTPTRP